MLVLALQWEKHSGPDSIGQHKLIFTMDESINHGEFNPMEIKKGAQFLVMMVPVDEEQELISETKEETLTRFRKHMFSLLTDISRLNGTSANVEKEKLKMQLKQSALIKESTTELSLEELANVIIKLKRYKNELTK